MSDLVISASDKLLIFKVSFVFTRSILPIIRHAFLIFLGTIILLSTTYSFAIDPQNPADRLKSGFFPAYLNGSYSAFLKNSSSKCLESLEKLKITPYTKESEKYYLLRALCGPKEQQPSFANNEIILALKEKGSSSDILYAAGLIFSQLDANQDAFIKFQEAIWFNSFSFFEQKDFYLDLGVLQYKLAMYAESSDSLIKALSLGAVSINAQYLQIGRAHV